MPWRQKTGISFVKKVLQSRFLEFQDLQFSEFSYHMGVWHAFGLLPSGHYAVQQYNKLECRVERSY